MKTTGNYSEGYSDGVESQREKITLLQKQFEDLKRQNLELQEQLAATNKVLEDKKRLTIEIEKAMFGECGASNPSLGDVLKSVQYLVKELAEVKSKAEDIVMLVPSLLQKLKEKGEPIELYAITSALSNYRSK